MEDILRPEGSNPGGGLKVEFSPLYNVAVFPHNIDHALAAAITFKAGARWYVIEVIENSLDYTCEPKETDAGQIWEVRLSGVVRGDNLALKRALSKMAIMNAFIVKYKENAGLAIVAGNLNEKLEFTYKKRSGNGMAALRSYTFTFSAILTNEPPVYTF